MLSIARSATKAVTLDTRTLWIDEDGNRRGFGHKLAQQPEPLGPGFTGQ